MNPKGNMHPKIKKQVKKKYGSFKPNKIDEQSK